MPAQLFTIPPSPADLLAKNGGCVKDVVRRPRRRATPPAPRARSNTSALTVSRARAQHDVASVCGVLEDAVKLLEKDSLAIAQPALFDPLYSVVDAFGRCPNNAREAARKLLFAATKACTKECSRGLKSGYSDDALGACRSALAMASYLLTWLVREAEKAAANDLSKAPPAAAKKGAKKGKKAAADDDDDTSWEWGDHREEATLLLVGALELDLSALWAQRTPDEAFVLLFPKAVFAVVEQPAAMKAAVITPATKDALWRLVALAVVQHGQGEATLMGLINCLLNNGEHAAPPLAECLEKMLEDVAEEATQFALALLHELAELSVSATGGAGKEETAAAKAVATFLPLLAAKAPLLLITNLDPVNAHLLAEPQALRCGVVSTYGKLIQHKPSQVPAELQPTIDGLPAVPLARTADANAFVRSRALHVLKDLAEARALPTSAYTEAAEKGLARLSDKNANVRRDALKLFRSLLEHNPFVPTLSQANLEELKAQLPAAPEPPAEAAAALQPAPPEADGEAPADGAAAAEGETPPAEAAEAAPPAAPEPTAEEVEAAAARALVENALQFAEVMRAKLPDVEQLLGSSTNSDIMEAMAAIVTAHHFDLDGARPQAILALVCSREQQVKTAALQAAQDVWLPAAEKGTRGPAHALAVTKGLIDLVNGASLAEETALEEVVAEWQKEKRLSQVVVQMLWEVLQGKHGGGSDDKRAAVALLDMAGAADPSLLRHRMDVLIAQLAKGAAAHLPTCRHACGALQKVAAAGPPLATAERRSLLRALENLLLGAPPAAQAEAWYGAAQQALNTAFAVCDDPLEWSSELLRQSGEKATTPTDDADGNPTVCSAALGRHLFAVGHTALKSLVHIEAYERSLAARAHADREEMAAAGGAPKAAAKKPAKGKGKKAADDDEIDYKEGENDGDEEADATARELGTAAAAAEADSDALLAMGDRVMAADGLIGRWAPLVVAVVTNADGHFPAALRASAVAALVKFMCVSASFCEGHCQVGCRAPRNPLSRITPHPRLPRASPPRLSHV